MVGFAVFATLGLFIALAGHPFIGIGLFLLCIAMGSSVADDDRARHENDYGKVARCYKCGSTRVYRMTYDDKRDSINFWGAASSKIGKRYHCDNCGNEW